jgi:hypothetical protein
MPMTGGSSAAHRRSWVGPGLVAGTLALGSLALAVPAAPAGAATATAPSPRPALCGRVRNQYARLVAQNKRAKTAFEKASALQQRVLRSGRTQLAHRLDTRLQYLRQIHVLLVDRVNLVASRVASRCSVRAPTLDSY